MRVLGGCAREHYVYASGRGLLGAAPPAVPDPSFEAQRAQLERVLGVTVTVLFLASVSYVTLTAMFGFLCAGRGSARRRPDGGTGAPEPPAAAAEDTKEIPVVVVAVPVPVPNPDDGCPGEEEAVECTVCLAEYACGEEVRVLPACRHGFHRECVDLWLLTRAPTCPVCRAPVAARPEGHGGKACATGDAALRAVAVECSDAMLPVPPVFGVQLSFAVKNTAFRSM